MDFSLPINWTTPKRYNAVISIPEGYDSIEPMSKWEGLDLISFTPGRKAKEVEPTEIISVHKLNGKRLSAIKLIDHYLTIVADNNPKLLLKEISDKKNQMAFFIIKYSESDEEKILGAKYFSGPYDCAGVLYTISLNQGLSEQDAVSKMTTFFSTNVKVIKF